LRSFREKNESCHRKPQPNVVMAGPAAGRRPSPGHDDEEEPSTTLLQPDLLNRTAVGFCPS
jgi:hypothetical protein